MVYLPPLWPVVLRYLAVKVCWSLQVTEGIKGWLVGPQKADPRFWGIPSRGYGGRAVLLKGNTETT